MKTQKENEKKNDLDLEQEQRTLLKSCKKSRKFTLNELKSTKELGESVRTTESSLSLIGYWEKGGRDSRSYVVFNGNRPNIQINEIFIKIHLTYFNKKTIWWTD